MLRFSSAEATRSFVVQWCRFPNLAFRFCFSNTFICVFDVSRARGYIYDLVPRVLRLLHLLVSPFLTSQQETLSCPRPLCPKISTSSLVQRWWPYCWAQWCFACIAKQVDLLQTFYVKFEGNNETLCAVCTYFNCCWKHVWQKQANLKRCVSFVLTIFGLLIKPVECVLWWNLTPNFMMSIFFEEFKHGELVSLNL